MSQSKQVSSPNPKKRSTRYVNVQEDMRNMEKHIQECGQKLGKRQRFLIERRDVQRNTSS